MVPPFVLSALTNKWVIGALLIAAIYGYIQYQSWEIKSLQEDVQISEANNKKLRGIVEDQTDLVDSIMEDYDKKQVLYEEREKLVLDLKDDNRELRKKLYREQQGKKSLEELAITKPGLVEKAVNRGTQKVLECFEKISKGKEEECLKN